jgi:hypothetical protein
MINHTQSHSCLWELQHEVLPVKHNHITEPVSLTWCYYVSLVVSILSPSLCLVPNHLRSSLCLSSTQTTYDLLYVYHPHKPLTIFFMFIIHTNHLRSSLCLSSTQTTYTSSPNCTRIEIRNTSRSTWLQYGTRILIACSCLTCGIAYASTHVHYTCLQFTPHSFLSLPISSLWYHDVTPTFLL